MPRVILGTSAMQPINILDVTLVLYVEVHCIRLWYVQILLKCVDPEQTEWWTECLESALTSTEVLKLSDFDILELVGKGSFGMVCAYPLQREVHVDTTLCN